MRNSLHVLFSSHLPLCFASAELFANSAIKGIITDAETARAASPAYRCGWKDVYGAYSGKDGAFLIKVFRQTPIHCLFPSLVMKSKKVSVTVRDGDTATVSINLRTQMLRTNDVICLRENVRKRLKMPVSITTVDAQGLQQRNITRTDDALLLHSGRVRRPRPK